MHLLVGLWVFFAHLVGGNIEEAVLNPNYVDAPLWKDGFDGDQQQYFIFNRFLKPLTGLQTEKLASFGKRLDNLTPRYQAVRGFVDLLKKAVDPEMKFADGLFRRRLDVKKGLESFGKQLLKTQSRAFGKLNKQYEELLKAVDIAETGTFGKFSRVRSDASAHVNKQLTRLAGLTKQTTAAIMTSFNKLNQTSSKTRELAAKYLNSSSTAFNKRLGREKKLVEFAEVVGREIKTSADSILDTVKQSTQDINTKTVSAANSQVATSLSRMHGAGDSLGSEAQKRLQGQGQVFSKSLDKLAKAVTEGAAREDGKFTAIFKNYNATIDKEVAGFRKETDAALETEDRRFRSADDRVTGNLQTVEAAFRDGAQSFAEAENLASEARRGFARESREFSSLAKSGASELWAEAQGALTRPSWSSSVLQRVQGASDAQREALEAAQTGRTRTLKGGIAAELEIAGDERRGGAVSEDARTAIAEESAVGRAEIEEISDSAEKMRSLRVSREAALEDERRAAAETQAALRSSAETSGRNFRSPGGSAAAEAAAKLGDGRFFGASDAARTLGEAGAQQWGVLGERIAGITENLPQFGGVAEAMAGDRKFRAETERELERRLGEMRDASDAGVARISGRATQVGSRMRAGAEEGLREAGADSGGSLVSGEELRGLSVEFLGSSGELGASEEAAAKKLQSASAEETRLERTVGGLEGEYGKMGRANVGRLAGQLAQLEEELKQQSEAEAAGEGGRLKKTSEAMLESAEKAASSRKAELESRKSRYEEIVEEVRRNVSEVERWHGEQEFGEFKRRAVNSVEAGLEQLRVETSLGDLNATLGRTGEKFGASAASVNARLAEYEGVYKEGEEAVQAGLEAKLRNFGAWLRGVVEQVDEYVNETAAAMSRGQAMTSEEDEVQSIVNRTKAKAEMTASELEAKVDKFREEARGEISDLQLRLGEVQEAGEVWQAEMFTADEEVAGFETAIARGLADKADAVMGKVSKQAGSGSGSGQAVMAGAADSLGASVGAGTASIGGQVGNLRTAIQRKQAEMEGLRQEAAGSVGAVIGRQGETQKISGEQMAAILGALEAGMEEKVEAMGRTTQVNGNQMASMRTAVGIFTNLVEGALEEKTGELRLLSDASKGLADDVDKSVEFLGKLVEKKVGNFTERASEVKKSMVRFGARIRVEQTGARDTLNGKIRKSLDEYKPKFEHELAVLKEKFQDTVRDGNKQRNEQLARLDEWMRGEEATVNGVVAGLMRGAGASSLLQAMTDEELIGDLRARLRTAGSTGS